MAQYNSSIGSIFLQEQLNQKGLERQQKRKRKILDAQQIRGLEEAFLSNANWSNEKICQLAEQFDITTTKVYKWNWDRKRKQMEQSDGGSNSERNVRADTANNNRAQVPELTQRRSGSADSMPSPIKAEKIEGNQNEKTEEQFTHLPMYPQKKDSEEEKEATLTTKKADLPKKEE